MIKIGDKVIYTGDPRKLKGKVIDIIYSHNLWVPITAVVELDDANFIPRQINVPLTELQLVQTEVITYDASNPMMQGCECGLKYCRDGGKHSTWCKLYRSD